MSRVARPVLQYRLIWNEENRYLERRCRTITSRPRPLTRPHVLFLGQFASQAKLHALVRMKKDYSNL